jgi:hypothetical protein
VHIITFVLLHKFFVRSFMITVQVNGFELVCTVITEEESIPTYSTKCTHNLNVTILHFESLLDPNVFSYYAFVWYNTRHLKKQNICPVNRHAVVIECVIIWEFVRYWHILTAQKVGCRNHSFWGKPYWRHWLHWLTIGASNYFLSVPKLTLCFRRMRKRF